MLIFNSVGEAEEEAIRGERAWFLEEESKLRNKLSLIDLGYK